MMKSLDPIALRSYLQTRPRVLITMHRGADGDAIGSALGLRHILKHFDIDAAVVSPDSYADFLHWLPDDQVVVNYERQPEKGRELVEASDAIFCLDFNSPRRLEAFEQVVTESGKRIFVIDHHLDPQPFAESYYVDHNASSTAEMVCRLTDEMGLFEVIDRKAALCLYTGIVTDTGSFRFSSVSADLMRLAARLLDTGFDHTRIYDEIFDSKTAMRQRLYGYALSEKLVVVEDADAAYISLSEEELNRFESRKGDTEGLVNEALSIRGVKMAGFFYERDGVVKISLRSKGHVDVSRVANEYFSGGGHVNAAGGLGPGTLEETCRLFESIARKMSQPNTAVS